jgi:hypothetical protein
VLFVLRGSLYTAVRSHALVNSGMFAALIELTNPCYRFALYKDALTSKITMAYDPGTPNSHSE